MGWASAGQIFDPVAQALIDAGATDDLKTTVLGKLIKQLQDGDWDTEDESLDQFKDDPAIVAAFRNHGVVVQCGDDTDDRWCEKERGHDGGHCNWNGDTWATERPSGAA